MTIGAMTAAQARQQDVCEGNRRAPCVDNPVNAAVRHLIGADDISILLVDLTDRTVEPLAEWGRRGPMDAAYSAFLVHVADIGAEAGPSWFSGAVGEGASLIARVTRRGSRAFLLVADFDRAGPAVRARALRVVPELVTLLKHHVRTAERVTQLEADNAAANIALDHGECGVAIVDAGGKLLFANTAAERFLADGDGLHLRRGEVRPTAYAEAIRFRAALDEVAEIGLHEPAGTRRRAMAMLLPRRDGGRPTVLAIAPACGRADAVPGKERSGNAILYMLGADPSPASRLEAVCRLHGLSRIETLLLTHLVSGLTLTEAAAKIRVKLETARAYLKQVFVKTGTHRQVDVVALMTRYARALRGDFDFEAA